MGNIIISTNTSLDGVVQDPDGKEGFRLGGWFSESGGNDLAPWAEIFTAEAFNSAALLLGRRSDEWFAERWVGRDGEWADALNALPKYVVSASLTEARWTNATVLTGNPVERVAELKRQLAGDIVIYASYQLGRTLIAHGLVDELRLVVFPIVVGDGERLFEEVGDKQPLRLVESRTVGENLTFVRYELVR